jgi:hypothetical protein
VVEVSEGRSEDQRERGEAGSGWSSVDLQKARAGFSRSWAGFSWFRLFREILRELFVELRGN